MKYEAMNFCKCLFTFLFSIFIFSACFSPDKNDSTIIEREKLALLKIDKEFAALSVEKGMKHAFLEYIDSNGVLLRPNSFPIIGGEAVDYLLAKNDTTYKMTWRPKAADVAASGDMGYTYGTYEIKLNANDSILTGTYVSIWKKEGNGKWKFVLDSGNEGVE